MRHKYTLAWIFILLMLVPLATQRVYAASQAPAAGRDLFLTVSKSLVVDSPVVVERISVGDPAIAEAVAVSPREILIHGKGAGDTSLIVWQQGGNRLFFDLHVRAVTAKIENLQSELDREMGQGVVNARFSDGYVFLRGTVNDLGKSERAVAIATTLGKPVNLLRVKVPESDPQILLKVRFANVDRTATQELGANFFSTGAGNTPGSVSTGQFVPPRPDTTGTGAPGSVFRLSDALNVFIFRPDLNIGATIKALETKRLLEVLAEPNLLTLNGKQASFLAGGEFPYPTLQGGGAGLGAVTIQFREFGVRINFVPVITPRGTIRLHVAPEVSSLDFANGLIFQGFTIPGLSTRRVSTDVELQDGQSFGIGGLLDNRVTESLSKIPGLGDIPFLGKLFQSRMLNKAHSELLVLVTGEIVRPIPAGQALPEVKMPHAFMSNVPQVVPRTPGVDKTGKENPKPPEDSLPVEKLIESMKGAPAQAPVAVSPYAVVPVPVVTPQPESTDSRKQ